MHPYRLITPYFPLALPFIFVHRTIEANELSLLTRPTLVCRMRVLNMRLYFSLYSVLRLAMLMYILFDRCVCSSSKMNIEIK